MANIQFGYSDPSQEPYGINQVISNSDNESKHILYYEANKNQTIPKKVQFKEELDFKKSEPLIFGIQNNLKPLRPKTAKKKPSRKSLSAKKKKQVSFKNTPKPAKIASPIKGEWNTNTCAPKFFDPSLNKKRTLSEKGEQKDNKQKLEINKEGQKIVGKIQTVGIPKTFEMYSDVNQLLNEERPVQSKTFLKKGKGNTISSVKNEPIKPEKGKENQQIQQNIIPAAPVPVILKNDEEEKYDPEKERMRREFMKKNEYLESLKNELEKERTLRTEMHKDYQNKVESMVNYVKSAAQIHERLKKHEADLDLVPQKEIPEPALTKVSPKKEQPQIVQKAKPRTLKPARVITRPRPPVFKPIRGKIPMPRSMMKTVPKKEEQKSASKKTSFIQKPKQIDVFTEEMKKREIERQIELDAKTNTALQRLDRLTNMPAVEIKEISDEINVLENKMKPAIEKVDQTIKDIERIERIKSKGTLLGMVSNISARYIVTYSDQLTELIVDDLMEEFACEMNEIEEQQKKNIFSLEQQELALELLEQANDLEQEQENIKNRWVQHNMQEIEKHEFKHQTVDLQISSNGEYKNPFAESMGKIAVPNEETKVITIYKPPRKTAIIPEERVKRIREYAKQTKEYKKKMEGSVSPDIWKIYDHITNDILASILENSAEELGEILEQCVEQMVSNEFAE